MSVRQYKGEVPLCTDFKSSWETQGQITNRDGTKISRANLDEPTIRTDFAPKIFIPSLLFGDAFKLSGRRVVELEVLAEALDGGWKVCNMPLQLSSCTDETLSGLGSFLYIVCSNSECGEINVCHRNKTHAPCCRYHSRTADFLCKHKNCCRLVSFHVSFIQPNSQILAC